MSTTPDTRTPPFHWTHDQARAWRIAAAIWDNDGDLFETVVAETVVDGMEAAERLIAALGRNLVVRLRMSIGADALDELIAAELRACDEEDGTETFRARFDGGGQ